MARTKEAPVETPDTDAGLSPARIKVLERRLRDPLGQVSAPIDLKDPSLIPHWFNGAISPDKIWRAKQAGWEPVKAEMLADPDQVGGFVKSPEGYVTRGDRGQEVLMAMPRDYYHRIQLAKAKANARNMGDPVATKNEVVSAAGDKLGDQAADFINRRVNIVGGVRDQHEIIQRDPGVVE